MKLYQKNTKRRDGCEQKGYITIVSSIIISVTLMMIVLDQSTAGFSARFAILDHERKTISERLAFSCAEIVRVKISENFLYEGNETITIHDKNNFFQGECLIKNITHSSKTIIFYTSASYQNIGTSLQIEIDSTNFRILKYLLQ